MSSEITINDTATGAEISLPSIGLGTLRTSATYAAMFIALEGDRSQRISVLNSVLEALGIFPEELAHERKMPDCASEPSYSNWLEEGERIRKRCSAA